MKTIVIVPNVEHVKFDLIWKKFEVVELCLYVNVILGPSASSHNGVKYRDDLDNYYDDEDANPGSLMHNSRTEPDEEELPPAPRPYKCQLKPNVSNNFHRTKMILSQVVQMV